MAERFKLLRQHVFCACFAGIMLFSGGCGQSTGDKLATAIRRNSEAQVFFNDRDYIKAIAVMDEAIQLNHELNRDSVLGENYLVKASCQRMLGQYDSAIAAFRVSLELFHLVGDQRLERKNRVGLADLLSALRRNEEALSLALNAAAEAKVFGDMANASQAMMLAGNIHHKLQNFGQEETLLQELLMNDSLRTRDVPKSKVFHQLFGAAVGTGTGTKIQTAFEQWRSYAASSGDSSVGAEMFAAWGDYQVQLHHLDTALNSYSRALTMISGNASRPLQVEILSALGGLSYRTQHYDNARLYFSDAENLAKQENNIMQDQLLRLMLVACDMMTSGSSSGSQSSEVSQRCQDIADACKQVHFRAAELLAYYIKGKLAQRHADTSAAVAAYRQAIRIDEENNLSETEDPFVGNLLSLFFDIHSSGWYDPLIEFYCKSKHSRDAFALIEERNLRDFSSFFWNSTIVTGDASFDQAMNEMRTNRNALSLLDKDILGELSIGRSRNLERFESLKEYYPLRLNEFLHSLGSIHHNNLEWLFHPVMMDLRAIQDTLPQGGMLVEFLPTPDVLYSLVVTKDSSYIRSTNVSLQHLKSLIREYIGVIGDARLNGNTANYNEAGVLSRIGELSPVLYRLIIEPIQSSVERATKLYIVPPMEFDQLPFHTLRGSGTGSLGVKIAVSYLPTAAVMLFKSESDKYVSGVVGLGYPGNTGWDVEYELKDIRSFYEKAKLLFDTAATLSHISPLSYELLHIAAEFTLDTRYPDRSAITLSDGQTPYGLVQVPFGRMLAVPMPQALVLSDIAPSAGALRRYLPMAFLANGVHTVVASMWQGERKSKRYFGEVFYTNVMQGIAANLSYQQAILAMTKQEEFSRLHKWGLYYCFGR